MRGHRWHIALAAGLGLALLCSSSTARGGGNATCGANATHDCLATGSPGCTDEECCNLVCGADPFCCDTAWDAVCVGEAFQLCLGIFNDDCTDAIPIQIGSTPFSTVGTTTDGPPTSCNSNGYPQINQDIWYDFVSPVTDPELTVSLCNATFDTKVAVYEGCSCPVGTELACNDSYCGTHAQVSWQVKTGECYKIRVGGYLQASGLGQIDITVGVPPGPCDNPNNHPCNQTGGPGCSEHDCCTTVCGLDPFCCDTAWDTICVNEASTYCAPCFACVSCPPEGVQEGEPCGTSTNGGCDSTPPSFQTISLTQSICGTAWAAGGQRDTDWYQFTVTVDGTDVYWQLYAFFPMMACIMNNDCGNLYVIAEGSGNAPVQAEAKLPAGTYVGFVADASFNGNPCGTQNNGYVVFLYGVLPCPADATGDGIINTADLLAVINTWGCQSACTADLNVDGIVNTGDLLMVINSWGPCP